MGLVYEPERVGAGEIPAYADGQAQSDAAVVLGESLAEVAQDNSEVLAYLLYGSAAWPNYSPKNLNRRSDVDLFVVTDVQTPDSTTHGSIAERIRAINATYNVNVSPIIFSREDLEGDTKLNPFYANHLCMVRSWPYRSSMAYFPDTRRTWGETRKNNLAIDALLDKTLFDFKLPFVEAWPFAAEYLKARRGQFQQQLDQIEPELAKLKGPFELPRNLGRMMVDFYNTYLSEYGVYDPELDEMEGAITHSAPDWENLLRLAYAAGADGVIGEHIGRLKDLDEAYTDLLESTVAGNTSLSDYRKWLQDVYTESFERAFALAEGAQIIVQHTVKRAQLNPEYDAFEITMYDGEPARPDIDEMEHKGKQIAPVAYDLDKLLFTIGPKYPDIAQRYQEHQARRKAARAESDAIAIEWVNQSRLELEAWHNPQKP